MRLFFIFYILFSFTLLAQHDYDHAHHISYIDGTIIDKEKKSFIQYATIKLINPDNDKVITGTVSNEDGYFKLDNFQPGKYNISIEFIGYETVALSDQLIVPPNLIKNLGEIKLILNTIEVDEVSIVEEKPFIEEKLDKKIYNVQEMDIAIGGTADEVLEQLPSISVDADGNIALRGSSNVNIMIDGRMVDGDFLEIFDGDMITQVEVITLPSAKYDPEGMAGIINVITNKNEYVGTSGKVEVGFGNTNRLAGTANYFNNNLNLYSSYNIANRDHKGYSERYMTITNSSGDIIEEVQADTDIKKEKYNENFKLSGDYYLNDMNSLYWDFIYSDYSDDSNEKLDLIQNYADQNIQDISEIDINTDNKYHGFYRNIVGGFSKDFDDGKWLGIEVSREKDIHDGFSNGEVYTNEHENHSSSEIYIDYEHPLTSKFEGKDEMLEVGFSDKVHNHLSTFNYNNFQYLKFQHSFNVLALYFNISHYFTKQLGIQAGARYEKSKRSFDPTLIKTGANDNDIFLHLLNQLNKTSSTIVSDNLYPSFYLNYDLLDKGNIKFGIGKRIQRPNDWHLVPIPHDFTEEKNIHRGNPNLLPEETTKYELSYSNRFPFGYLTSTLYFNTSKNVFDYDVDEISLNGEIYTVLSHDNLAKTENTGIDLFFMTQPKKWWDLRASVGLDYSKTIEAYEMDQQGSETGIWFSIMQNFKIKDDMKLDVTTWAWQRRIQTGKIHPMKAINLSFRKDFKKRYSLIFKVRDLLNSQAFSITTDNFSEDTGYYKYLDYEGKRRGRDFSINLQYKFGDFKENKIKRSSESHDHDHGSGEMNYGY